MTPLDLCIEATLATGCRQSAQDIAAEAGASPRTVIRRLKLLRVRD